MLVVPGRGFFIQLAKKMAGEIQPYTKWLDPLLRRKQVIPASSVAIVTIEKASQNVRRWAREIADESAPPECCHYISQQHEMQRWYGARLFVRTSFGRHCFSFPTAGLVPPVAFQNRSLLHLGIAG